MNSELEQDAYGVLEQKDNRWRLRFSRSLTHPPDKVWRAITEGGASGGVVPAAHRGGMGRGCAPAL